jgi:hypothetical protein
VDRSAKIRTNPQIKRRGRRGWPAAVIAEAQRIYNDEPEPTWAQMHRDLQEIFGEYDAPTESTLRDWAKRGVIAKDDQDAPWSFAEGNPDDAALVLPIARAMWIARLDAEAEIRKTGKRLPPGAQFSRMTRRTARWIVRIRKARPEVPLGTAWILAARAAASDQARAMGSGNARDEGIDLVQTLLELEPWEDEGVLLNKAIASGAVPESTEEVVSGFTRVAESLIEWETCHER